MTLNALKLLTVLGTVSLCAPLAQAQDNIPARDASTSSIDVKLINQCIESGQSKKDCLCVTKIHKYELSLAEYKLAAKAFGRSPAGANSSPHVINVAHKEKMLINSGDFQERCNMASRYFSQSQRQG